MRHLGDPPLDSLLAAWRCEVLPQRFPDLPARPHDAARPAAIGTSVGAAWNPLTQPLGPAFWTAMRHAWSYDSAWMRVGPRPRRQSEWSRA